MFAALLSLLLEWAAAYACSPPPAVVPTYTIPRGEVPRDVSAAPKTTTNPAKPEGR